MSVTVVQSRNMEKERERERERDVPALRGNRSAQFTSALANVLRSEGEKATVERRDSQMANDGDVAEEDDGVDIDGDGDSVAEEGSTSSHSRSKFCDGTEEEGANDSSVADSESNNCTREKNLQRLKMK